MGGRRTTEPGFEANLKIERWRDISFESILLSGGYPRSEAHLFIRFLLSFPELAQGGTDFLLVWIGRKGLTARVGRVLSRMGIDDTRFSTARIRRALGLFPTELAGWHCAGYSLQQVCMVLAETWWELHIRRFLVCPGEVTENCRELTQLVGKRVSRWDRELMRHFGWLLYIYSRYNVLFNWKKPRSFTLEAVRNLIAGFDPEGSLVDLTILDPEQA